VMPAYTRVQKTLDIGKHLIPTVLPFKLTEPFQRDMSTWSVDVSLMMSGIDLRKTSGN
jgi:hypothetical protein